MTAKRLTAAMAMQLLDYNPETGLLLWRYRQASVFDGGKKRSAESKAKQWNKRYADRRAGCKSSKGYLHVRIFGRLYEAHRVAWLIVHGRWPRIFIDHKNHVRDDIRIDNLREADHSQNGQNRRCLSKNNTSGFAGVTYLKRHEKWQARIIISGKCIALGNFDSAETASIAYQSAKAKLHPFASVSC